MVVYVIHENSFGERRVVPTVECLESAIGCPVRGPFVGDGVVIVNVNFVYLFGFLTRISNARSV